MLNALFMAQIMKFNLSYFISNKRNVKHLEQESHNASAAVYPFSVRPTVIFYANGIIMIVISDKHKHKHNHLPSDRIAFVARFNGQFW